MSKSLFNVSFTVDSDDAKKFALSHARRFGGEGFKNEVRRSSDKLKEQATEIFQDALENICFAFASVEVDQLILPESSLKMVSKLADLTDIPQRDRLVKYISENLIVSIVSYVATRGPFTNERFWLLVGENPMKVGAKKEAKRIYVSFPDLSSTGNHGAILMAFSDSISNYLKAGGPSSVVSFCEASGETIHKSKLPFAFKKGMHVKKFPEGCHGKLLKDLDIIFTAMKGAKGSGNFTLEWLNEPLVEE